MRGKKSEGIYFIDSTIKKEVEEKVKLDEGRIKGMQFLKVYKNDSIVIDSYAWQTPFETQILSRLKRDTVYIASKPVSFTNLGFSIAIFRTNNSTLKKVRLLVLTILNSNKNPFDTYSFYYTIKF
ncbi:MAG: hypothetical protein IPF72_19760 [Chitinophagaceae bacterium]|nr:hypothetical protein [Chitinophagaceae bacterium]